jgi:ABC-type nitrate/sulfonate/bicarbonate transport system permease component
MADQSTPNETAQSRAVAKPAPSRLRVWAHEFFELRSPTPLWQSILFGLLCLATVYALWSWVTYGEVAEERIVTPAALPSPAETFAKFHDLWFEMALTRNLLASLQRVTLGFALAALIGVPLGILCGCFSWANAFFAPISVFGRNIPIAALIPMTFLLFHTGELQKVMFIFIACVAFVLTDTARAITEVGQQYIDTAYTLGASRRQTILKVLVPLAMPSVFNSLRLLFGLAFGYIMLAEVITTGDHAGGLGNIIQQCEKRGLTGQIILVLMIIPIVALAIDRLIYWVQCELFPYRYGGVGLLNSAVEWGLHRWEDAKGLVVRPAQLPSQLAGMTTAVSPAAAPQPAESVASSSSSSPTSSAPEPEKPK